MSLPPSDLDNSKQGDRVTVQSRPGNAPELHEHSSARFLSEPTTADLLGLDNIPPAGDSLSPPPSTTKLDITDVSLLDRNQESGVMDHDMTIILGLQPRHSAPAADYDFLPLETEIEILSSTTLESESTPAASETEIGAETQIEAYENNVEDDETIETGKSNQFHLWSVSSERIVNGAIQCLTETQDMELSYVSLLSAITVLNHRQSDRGSDDHEEVNDKTAPENVNVVAAAQIRDEDPVSKLYAQLLGIMTRPSVAEELSKETLRQGVITLDTLYIRLYKAILNAGYQLQDEDHVRLGQFLFDRQNTEDALYCLDKIDLTRWTSHIYRLAISCHLFTKPRHLHEAEILLDQYLAHNKALSSSSSSCSSSIGNQGGPRQGSRESRDTEREQFNKSLIQIWFKQQLDASKWDEIKVQYERRRARLLDAPSNIERLASMLDKESLSAGLNGHRRGGSSVSRASVVAEHGSVASGSAESLAAEAAAETTGAALAPTSVSPEPPAVTASPKRPSFSLFSAFRSSKLTITTAPVPTIQTRDLSRPSPLLSASTNTIQVNRHLTILDNGMLEECVNHKQFEYGWSIYERMGPSLEDKDTAKIVMRLCKRAFLGHGGLGPNLPGSPRILAKDVDFEDEAVRSATAELGDRDARTGTGLERVKTVQEDPEIWEARAWVIYNKAMMNPYFLNSTGSPSNSPTQAQSSGVAPGATLSTPTIAGANRGNGTLTSPLSSMAGTTALSVFLHNILTVAINSQERSSRYLKAFRIYSTMRNDPLNQYQSQLRDPFVMTCMIKAIYDTVLILVRAQDQQRQQLQQQQSCHSAAATQQRQGSVSSLAPNQQQKQQMTIGPLIDLAFEIYADMRNVGPIRHLPRLSALAPSTPIPKTPQTAQAATGGSNGGSSMSIFFQLSSRAPTSVSTAVDLSACGVTAPSSGVPTANTANTPTTSTTKNSVSSITGSYASTTSSNSSPPSFPCVLQDLNLTLQPTIQARRLPTELYLALLHLCIQVPLSGVSVSSQVVKTIVADMVSTKPGQQPANLDRHLAAALQVYHDRWMCRTVELKGRRRCQNSSGNDKGRSGESEVGEEGELDEVDLESEEVEQNDDDISEEEAEEGVCIFHGWMYRPEEYVLKYMASSSSSSSSSDLADNNTTTTDVNELSLPSTDERDSPFEVSEYDADLDELDRYLDEKKVGLSDASEVNNISSDRRGLNPSEGAGTNSWMDGLDHDTCNGRFYWDMWSREDSVLQEIRFSRRRARMLWRHVAEL
ncbi:hypothetical protein BG015_010437 [Linnemannia schmuckeri]|uniref:Uncharacterized protein n=1 Tax=Linnemannia schmuckeri TaxID=64567 RepID=A0A9P5RWT1_9FUNG|nr:hypothetical protein BG015_010437 [Linnemannia schmuckeri]